MKRHLVAMLLATVLLMGCSTMDKQETLVSRIGNPCSVQFRRDALGAGAALLVSPRTGSINGTDVSMRGKLLVASPNWIVIESNGKEYHIPRAVILLIEFD